MFAHERQQHILRLLEKKQRMKVQDLQKELRISPATLRRDLGDMEDARRIVRVHGGVMHPAAFSGEPSLEEKRHSFLKEKKEIARQVHQAIPAGATVLIDSGTTCLETARLLQSRSNLTLITNSIPLLQIHTQSQARLVFLGGEVRSVSGAMVGNLTLNGLKQINADIALIGASGLSDEGTSTTELQECAVKQAMIQRAKRSWLLVDASKWNRPSTFNFASWQDFDRLFCNRPLPVPKHLSKAKKKQSL